jgi:hypothetical protein
MCLDEQGMWYNNRGQVRSVHEVPRAENVCGRVAGAARERNLEEGGADEVA